MTTWVRTLPAAVGWVGSAVAASGAGSSSVSLGIKLDAGSWSVRTIAPWISGASCGLRPFYPVRSVGEMPFGELKMIATVKAARSSV